MKAVNLIPTEQRPSGKGPAAPAAKAAPGESAIGAYVILAALAFAIAASALFVTTKNGITSKKSDLADVQRQADVVKQQAGALQSFADFKQLADSRSETVVGLASARFPWASTLDNVSRALPSDVYISSLDGTTDGAATGGSSLRSAIIAPSIELNGCTSSQSSVARLMSRMRDVPGVTRVTLAKSEKADTTGSAVAPAPATAADGSTSATISAPCPKGAPPAFDMIVFFERAKLDPNAAPNPAAVAAGPTGAAGATSSTGPTGSTTTASATSTPTP